MSDEFNNILNYTFYPSKFLLFQIILTLYALFFVLIGNHNCAFIANIIINVILGATIIHEMMGPLVSKWALKKAHEI